MEECLDAYSIRKKLGRLSRRHTKELMYSHGASPTKRLRVSAHAAPVLITLGCVCRRAYILLGGAQVLRSGVESQRIAVWRLLYRLQHPGQYLSRLQTDWLTHDVVCVSSYDSGIPIMAISVMMVESSAARA